MGGFVLLIERIDKFSATVPYVFNPLVFAIPYGRSYSSLAKLFFPFKMTVWICVCSSLLLVITVIVVLKLFSKKKRDFVVGRNNDAPFLNLIQTCLGGTMTGYQLPRRNFARTMLGIVLLTTLILRNAYLGNLFNFLRIQKRMEPFYHIQDIFDSDVTIFIISPLFERYQKEFPHVKHR